MERDTLMEMEVFFSQRIENDSSASDNLNGRDDDSDNTAPEETNENDQVDESEGYTGDVCIRLKAKLTFNIFYRRNHGVSN